MTQAGVFPWSKPMPHTHQNIGQGGTVRHDHLTTILPADHHALPDLGNIVNPCVCYASRNAAQVIPFNTNTKILFDAELFDVGANFRADGVNSDFTAPSDGYYLISSHGAFMNLPAGADQTLDIRVNGGVVAKSQFEVNVQSTEVYMECVTIQALTAGQVITSFVRHTGGADKSLFGGVTQTYIVVVKLGA